MVEKKADQKTEKKKAPRARKAAEPASVGAASDPVWHRKVVTGIVVSDKMQKTIVVEISRRVRHSRYGKYVNRTSRFKAHDETNQAKPGDVVALVETRPVSADKRWALQEIIRKGNRAAVLSV